MTFSDIQAKKDQKASTEAAYRAKRKARKHELIALHKSVIEEKKKELKKQFEIGFRARRLLRNGEIVDLPEEYRSILKACKELIDNPRRFDALYAFAGDCINNIQCRRLIAKVMACILPSTDLIGGRIGMPTQAGIKPISLNELQEEYALRFGEYLSPKSCAKVITYLRRAGYLRCERINVVVDQAKGEIRSSASYKQLSESFFSDLKVVRYKNIIKSILATRKKYMATGLSYKWIEFRTLANKVQELYNALQLNDVAESTTTVFHAFLAEPDLGFVTHPPH